MRVVAVESLDALTAEQADLLERVIEKHAELRRETLVVYRLSDSMALVAPRSSSVGAGDFVSSSGWMHMLQSVQFGDEGGAAELHVTERVVPYRLDP